MPLDILEKPSHFPLHSWQPVTSVPEEGCPGEASARVMVARARLASHGRHWVCLPAKFLPFLRLGELRTGRATCL